MGQEGEKYILSLRRHLFATPRFEISITLSVVLILIIPWIIYRNIWEIMILFVLPYIFVNIMDYGMIKLARIYFPIRRSISLNLLVYILALIQIFIFQIFFQFYFSVFLSFSSVVFIRGFVYFVFMRRKPIRGVLTSLNYNIIYIIISTFLAPRYTIPYIISTGLYTITFLFVLRISVAKFVREFSEDPLWFISSFVNYLSNNTKENVKCINKFFENIYTTREVPVSSMVFWSNDSPKAIFVFPYIHPGPFGDVGGSNITKKLRDFTGYNNLMVFHTTTTHDNNVADNRDVKKIAELIKKSVNNKKRYDKMSDVVRFKIDGFEVLSQIFGKSALIALLPTIEIFDDVDLHSGLILRKKLLNYYEDCVMIDAHNNFDEGAFPLTLTRKDIDQIVDNIKNINPDAPIKLGYSQRSFDGPSFGPDGIKVAVFQYKNKKIGYILLDGNNIKKGLRRVIRKSLKDLLDEIEVFSTDNHIVNYDILDLNPIGDKENWDLIIEKIRESVKEAIKNIEDVKVSTLTENIKFRMARRGQLQKMTDITKEALKTVKITMPLVILGGFLGSLLSFIYL